MKNRQTTETSESYWQARENATHEARGLIVRARILLKNAGATAAANACHRAQKSIEGAYNHARGRKWEAWRKTNEVGNHARTRRV